MNGSGLTASDVLAITRSEDGMGFGGVGGFILLFIFLMAIGGNGFGWGNNGTALGLADIQASLYNQTQDANSRALQNSIGILNDTVLSGKYDNALLMKDASQQLSNSIAGIGNLIVQENQATRAMLQQNYINELSDKLMITRDELSNVRQTAQITENILGSLATIAPKPPCYYPCAQTTTTTPTT